MAPSATGIAVTDAMKRRRLERLVIAFTAVVVASPIAVIAGCSLVWLD